MFRLFEFLDNSKAGDPPRHLLAVIVRCSDCVLFEEGPYGPSPFLSWVGGPGPLPPSFDPEAVLYWVRRLADQIELRFDDVLRYDLRPTWPLRPFANAKVHTVILDLREGDFTRLQFSRPKPVLISMAQIRENAEESFFYPLITEAPWVTS